MISKETIKAVEDAGECTKQSPSWSTKIRPRTQDECRIRFTDRVLAMRVDIYEIDRETPWSEVEPKWWLEMMEIDKQLTQFLANRA